MFFIEILKVIVLGIVEGITEWLPISSTGHMMLLEKFWPLVNQSEDFKDAFFYTIHFGAILAVVCLFFKKLFPFGRKKKTLDNGKIRTIIAPKKKVFLLWAKVAVACIPALIGLVVGIPDSPLVIALALIFYGILFILVEDVKKKKQRPFKVEDTYDITFGHALIIGCAQVLAIIPGTSRSGVTILAALLIGISRPAGAEFTFFLAIPVMVGASALKIFSALISGYAFTFLDFSCIVVGCTVAFIISLATVKLLMNFVKKHDFTPFGWYRIVLGLIVLILVASGKM